MGRTKHWPPPIYPHKGYDRIRITVNGRLREFNLGRTGTPEAHEAYLRKVAEFGSNNGRPAPPSLSQITVAELSAAYLLEAETFYSKRQFWRVKRAMQPVALLYRRGLAADFGPLSLKAVRQTFVDAGYCRKLCNQLTGCVRRAWKWAAANELIPQPVYAALTTVSDLQTGHTVAIDHPDIEPVALVDVMKTLPFLNRQIAAMAQIQLFTGCRPGEVCFLRPADVDRTWKKIDGVWIWLFRLEHHKNAWRNHKRRIPIGPQAQQILQPFLDRAEELFCFRPIDAMAEWRAKQRAARKTPVQPSQKDRSKPYRSRPPGERYTTTSYSRAVREACLKAGVDNWCPLQIRHAAATEAETLLDQDAARCLLGQATPTATAVYAKGLNKAAKFVAQFG